VSTSFTSSSFLFFFSLGNFNEVSESNNSSSLNDASKISFLVDSYSEVLRKVKTGYIAQSTNIQYAMNRISSDTNNTNI
jgi:hypothetical protein